MGRASAAGARADDRLPDLVVRPKIPWVDYATRGTVFLVAFGFVAVIYVAVAAIHPLPSSKEIPVVPVFGGIVAFSILVGLRLYLVSRFASLRVDRQELVRTNEFGIPRRLSSDGIGRIYEASFHMGMKYPYVMTYFLFLGRNGRTLFKLYAKWWPQEDMQAIGAALDVPVNGAINILSAPAYRSAFPGSISWVVAHPLLAATVVGPLFAVAAFIAALVLLSLLPAAS
jgi:hypothetical protein